MVRPPWRTNSHIKNEPETIHTTHLRILPSITSLPYQKLLSRKTATIETFAESLKKQPLMAYQSRTRKRVNALRRAPDGSAFQTCKSCGVSVAIVLLDMHDCESKKGVKRSKGENGEHLIWEDVEQRFQDQPRSEFRFFMESFAKNRGTKNLVEIEREGFKNWKNMSSQEKLPYELEAKKVNDAYFEKLLQESEDQMFLCVDEEADSADVGKFDKMNGSYDYDSYDSDYEGNGFWW